MSEFECTPVEVNREKRDGEEWRLVAVRKAKDGNKMKLTFREAGDVGKGTFGTVRKIITQDGSMYALKRLEHDPRFKNREVAIMRELDHGNCCRLFYYFSEKVEGAQPEMRINLVMEFMPDTLSALVSRTRKQSEELDPFIIQLYLYQLLRGTAYLHSKKIAHRDIKPQNILIDTQTSILKICDFGSAKRLTEGEPNVAYICSRFYRAPELILGNTHYDVSIDTWAIGCVFAELFLLKPIFVGGSCIDQLTEIIRVLGTPTPEQMDKLHPKFPKTLKKRDPVPLLKALKNKPSVKAIRLLTKMLQYMPETRIRCWEALAEPFFDDLRKSNARQPDGKSLPPLFDFTSRELEQNPVLNQLLMPGEAGVPESPNQISGSVNSDSEEARSLTAASTPPGQSQFLSECSELSDAVSSLVLKTEESTLSSESSSEETATSLDRLPDSWSPEKVAKLNVPKLSAPSTAKGTGFFFIPISDSRGRQTKSQEYQNLKEKSHRLFSNISFIAKRVGMTQESANILTELIVKHEPDIMQWSRDVLNCDLSRVGKDSNESSFNIGSNSSNLHVMSSSEDSESSGPLNASANCNQCRLLGQIRKRASELMDAKDVAKLDEIFTLFRHRMNKK